MKSKIDGGGRVGMPGLIDSHKAGALDDLLLVDRNETGSKQLPS